MVIFPFKTLQYVLLAWQKITSCFSRREILARRERAAQALCPTSATRPKGCQDAAAVAAPLKNESKSALIWSALVAGIPCGKPG